MHVYFIKKTNTNISKNDPYVVHASKQLNKFKKIKFLKTHNLLTGETSATPEQIEVIEFVYIFYIIYVFHLISTKIDILIINYLLLK